ncbi:hypothetical protein [Herbaspirillum seropedicae]|uniref:hypothetical protein n=1 Tax=Herbaspirillum seropedicae TaxID=964 RepID=UPI000847F56D|nr:hypothetical protein [Herbaspirillum seropedicae]AON53781.1 hypothetical protein Hsc_1478 [Herbaspirillum seropedicae]
MSATTKQVFEHHLGAFSVGLDELLKDYENESSLITPTKTYTGLKEIGAFFQVFLDSVDAEFWTAFKIVSMSTVGDVAYLAWESKPSMPLATDTLVIKNGRIAVQTFTPFPR